MHNRYWCFLFSLSFLLAGCDSQAPQQSASREDAGGSAIGAEARSGGDSGQQEVEIKEGCDINAPLPGRTYERVQPLSAWGYAFDPASGEISENVRLRLESEASSQSLVVEAKRGRREDVAKALGREELAMSGFGAEIDVSALPPGQYSLTVIQQLKTGTVVCKSPAPFTLR